MEGAEGEVRAQEGLKEVEGERENFGGVLQLRPQLFWRKVSHKRRGSCCWVLRVAACLGLWQAASCQPGLPRENRKWPCHTVLSLIVVSNLHVWSEETFGH